MTLSSPPFPRLPGWRPRAVRARILRGCNPRHVQLAVRPGPPPPRSDHRLPVPPHSGHPQPDDPRAQQHEGRDSVSHHEAFHEQDRPGE